MARNERESGAVGLGWILLGVVLLLVVGVLLGHFLWRPGAQPAEGMLGHFRLLNRDKNKHVQTLQVWRRDQTGTDQNGVPTFGWTPVTLSSNAWGPPLAPKTWYSGETQGQLDSAFGVKVTWQMEGDPTPRELAADESSLGGTPRPIQYVLLTTRADGTSPSVLHVLTADTFEVYEAAEPVQGALEVINCPPQAPSISGLLVERLVMDPAGNPVWEDITPQLVEGNLIQPVACGDFAVDNAGHLFENVYGVRLHWGVDGQPPSQVREIGQAMLGTQPVTVRAVTLEANANPPAPPVMHLLTTDGRSFERAD